MAVTRYFHCQYCMVQEAHHDVGVVLVTLLALCVWGGGGLTRFGTAPNAWMVRGLLFLVIYVYVWIHIYKIDT